MPAVADVNKMEALINRVGSPMDICVEGLDEPPDKLEERRKLLSVRQRTRSRIHFTYCLNLRLSIMAFK